MRGCLTLPFRIVLLALLGAALFLAWTYRDELRRRIHAWTAESEVAAEGRADPGLVPGARSRLAELGRTREGGGRDSVVLTAAEVASLLADEAGRRVPGAVDSVEVRLGPDDVEVRARVDTRLVKTPLGPAGPVLRDREWIEAGGRLTYRRAGLAEWQLGRVRVRGLPIPRNLLEGVLRQLSGQAPAGVVEVPVPAAVTGLRAAPTGLVWYGPGPRR